MGAGQEGGKPDPPKSGSWSVTLLGSPAGSSLVDLDWFPGPPRSWVSSGTGPPGTAGSSRVDFLPYPTSSFGCVRSKLCRHTACVCPSCFSSSLPNQQGWVCFFPFSSYPFPSSLPLALYGTIDWVVLKDFTGPSKLA